MWYPGPEEAIDMLFLASQISTTVSMTILNQSVSLSREMENALAYLTAFPT